MLLAFLKEERMANVTPLSSEYVNYMKRIIDLRNQVSAILASNAFNMSTFNSDSLPDDKTLGYPNHPQPLSFFNETKEIAASLNSLLQNGSNISKDTHTANESYESDLESTNINLNLYIGGYFTLTTTIVGFVLNMIGIYLLSRRQGLQNIFNIIFMVNLIFDTTYLIFQAIRSVNTHLISSSNPPKATSYILTNSGERFTYIASVLMLIALTHSRYQAATSPHEYRQIKLLWSKRRNQLLKYIFPTMFFASLFTIPVIFEIDTEEVFSVEGQITEVVPSKLRLNLYYSIFLKGGLNLGILGVLPFCSFLYFTYHIVKSLNQRSIDNHKASKTLIFMIVSFLLLHSFRIVTNIGEVILLFEKNKISVYDLQHDRGIPEWLEITAILGNICMVMNASVNYLIYHFLN